MLKEMGFQLAGIIERSPVSKFLQNLPNEVPITQSFHLIGICLLVGAAATVSLRLFGWANKEVPARELVERYLPFMRIGLGLATVSGIVMLGTEPSRSLPSDQFHIKVALLVGVFVGTRLFMRLLPSDETRIAGSGVRALAAIYMISLALIAVCGRWIAYAA
jgi:hypothetical protein